MECCKCENKDISIRYIKEESNRCIGTMNSFYKIKEHLLCTCQTCGYTWEEPCKDADND